MQTTKFRILSSLVLGLSLSAGACAGLEEAPQETEVVQTFTKQVTISDGENEVLLTLTSQNQAAIDAIGPESYTIRPIFERPESVERVSSEGEVVQESNDQGSLSDVVIESEVVHLVDGAVGYELGKEVEQELVAATAMGCSHNTHIDTDNFARVTKNGSVCTTAKISTRRFGIWTQRAFSNNFCPGDVLDDGRSPSDRVRAKVCTGMSYTVVFYN